MAAIWRMASTQATFSYKMLLFPQRNTILFARSIPLLFQGHDAQITRSYSSHDDEYSKLWSAATGGRGTGRGRKKKKEGQAGVDVNSRKHGQGEKKWEGFNAPILLKDHADNKKEKKEIDAKTKSRPPRPRGWCGTTWPGKSVGNPILPDKGVLSNFDSVVIELSRVSNTTKYGKQRSQRALVVVGNKNGAAGFGVAQGRFAFNAVKKARNKAANYLYHFERCDDHTIFHDFESKYKQTRVIFQKKPSGYGLRCHRAIKSIAQLIGIDDMRCKIIGATTPLSLVHAVFQGFLSQETHQELADRTGLNVVELRQELDYRPTVVAKPSHRAAKISLKKRVDKEEYDLAQIFDPNKGLHRAKHRSDLL